MEYNSDFRWDLKRGQDAEKWFGGLLTGDCIEVKRDFRAHATGNVFVEFECRGKPSGISTSEAIYWVFIYGPNELDLRCVLLPLEVLKEKAREKIKEGRITLGGDSNLSKAVLIALPELLV